ncbi:zinc ribbon domain-containing protein [Candidatus Methylacidiphilum fumarolicum]|uniref:zinc ribbon domain-containing protein n=1 Tax=Candidatus Methylacidiphilum fumarolicum TaxID=591154 RepID=UPI00141B4AAC
MKPSQRCHRCGGVVKKTLGDRWHECACGASCHRDENSALGLLDWGLAKWEKDHGFAFLELKVLYTERNKREPSLAWSRKLWLDET